MEHKYGMKYKYGMYSIESKFGFEAAHRLYDVDTYSKECSDSVHGHSYKVLLEVSRRELNDAGMVMDFKLFKKICREVIEDKYDHSLILRDCDPLVPAYKEVAPEQKLNVVKDSPTAEWMARVFYEEVQEALSKEDEELLVTKVSVQETENNVAVYCPLMLSYMGQEKM